VYADFNKRYFFISLGLEQLFVNLKICGVLDTWMRAAHIGFKSDSIFHNYAPDKIFI